VLEVGLGFGTACQRLAGRGLDYYGVDLAESPVAMARHRLSLAGVDEPENRVVIGSALDLPHPDQSFDHVVTIGCLHHTGDIPLGVAEINRVLRPGGRALVMLYNRHSYRHLKAAYERLIGRSSPDEEAMRAAYDRSADGSVAPTTDYTSAWQARRLFRRFSKVRVRRENFDFLTRRGELIDRDFLLGWPARLAGLDLYNTAVK
jgi:ubiquinone/menaquinone biosynthesis C-methylase UbiE